MLVLGILWGGIALHQKLSLTQSAREGARYAATLPFEGSTPGDDWFEEVATRIEESASGELTADVAAFCIRFVNPEEGDEAVRFFPDPPNEGVGEITDRYGANCEVEAGAVATRTRVEVVTARQVRLDFALYDFTVYTFSESIARFEPTVTP